VVWTGGIAEGSRWKQQAVVMHLDVILLVILAALAVWTEVDKLKSRGLPQS